MFSGARTLSRMNRVTQRSFASEKVILERLTAVQNIKKITKAMKMVSASKMKGDLFRLENGKDFAHESVDMIFKCDTYMQRKTPPESSDQKQLIVPVTSDRGLCGGINSGILREMKAYVADQQRENCELFVIGEKGSAGCARPFPDLLRESVQGLSTPCNFAQTMALT